MRALNSRETYELMGLLYALAIKGDFKKVEVALNSSRHESVTPYDLFTLDYAGHRFYAGI